MHPLIQIVELIGAAAAGSAVGSASGSGAASATGAATGAATASSSGVGAASGVGRSTATATASAAGTSAASAVAAAESPAVASAAGTSTATAIGDFIGAAAPAPVFMGGAGGRRKRRGGKRREPQIGVIVELIEEAGEARTAALAKAALDKAAERVRYAEQYDSILPLLMKAKQATDPRLSAERERAGQEARRLQRIMAEDEELILMLFAA